MRVLVLTPDYPPARGGIQLLIHRLLRNFEAVEPRVVALGAPGDREFDAAGEIAVRRVGRKQGGRNRTLVARLDAAGLWEGLRWRPEIVLSGHIVTAPAAAAVARARGGRFVQYLHGDEFRTRPGLARRAVGWADAVIAVSRHTRQMAIESGCPPDRITVIPPGVDLPPAVRRDPDPTPTILTVARLVESYKGHDVMIEALGSIGERVPGARWQVVGDGPLREPLEAAARSRGVADVVQFLGGVDDAERDRLYERAHLFAMPSRLPSQGLGGEGFGIVYLEAGAHGLPSVAGNVAGARDAVVDGETGLLVDPADPRAVADAATALLTDPERAERMGGAARAFAEEHSWGRIAARVEELMRGLADARG